MSDQLVQVVGGERSADLDRGCGLFATDRLRAVPHIVEQAPAQGLVEDRQPASVVWRLLHGPILTPRTVDKSTEQLYVAVNGCCF